MKKVYILAAALAAGTTAFAQKTVQNLGAVIPARDAVENADYRGGAVIWSDDFSTGISNWTVNTISGPVDWKYTTVGHTGAYPTASLSSTTAGNGWAIVDSDADNFSGGGNEDSRLELNNTVDCSGATQPVKLEFEQMFREWQADITTVSVSTDNGITWTDWEINAGVGQQGVPNPDVVTIDITSAIAANPSAVSVRFWWQGAWDYGWQIDDIRIAEIQPNDLRLFNTYMAGTGLPTYYKTPETQIVPLEFGGDISNIGQLAQTNVMIDVDVNSGSFTGSTTPVASIAPGTVQTEVVSGTFTPAGMGMYSADFSLSATETDDDPTNNTGNESIEVTDTIYAHHNGVYGGQWFNQDDGNGNSTAFHAGVLYNIAQDDVASSISVFVGDQTDPGAVLVFKLFELNPVDTTYIQVAQAADLDVTAAHLGNWVTLPLTQGYLCSSSIGTYMAAVEHFGGTFYSYIGYGTNPGVGYSTSSDDGVVFANQPRVFMIELNMGVGVGLEEEQISSVWMGQNQPNPANGTTQVRYNLAHSSQVAFEVIDVTGKKVIEMNEGQQAAGANQINFSTETLDAGVYFYSIITEDGRATKQMVVTK